MGKMETFQPAPPAAVSRVLATFDRDQLAGFIAVAIDLLDFADGDPDAEDGDFDFGADDTGENRTWIETTDQRQIADHALASATMDDDAEDDDPSGQRNEDGVNTGGDPGLWYEDCDLEPPRVPPQWPVSPAND